MGCHFHPVAFHDHIEQLHMLCKSLLKKTLQTCYHSQRFLLILGVLDLITSIRRNLEILGGGGIFLVKDPPPPGFLYGDCTKSIQSKSTIPTG